ncbi:MAG: mismatch endonuclease Vsr [Candidatus Levybacteria bacterium]|nr:mismatch endonuclease Vsr [Candidatus Levybacteria bacterium]
MSHVKSKDSGIEMIFRKELWKNGFRYRKNSPKYFGKPDIVLKKYKAVIFIDSCFWHGCPKHLRMPSSNQKYWKAKIIRNKKRDKEINSYFEKNNWKLIRLWEHDILEYPQKFPNLIRGVLKLIYA